MIYGATSSGVYQPLIYSNFKVAERTCNVPFVAIIKYAGAGEDNMWKDM